MNYDASVKYLKNLCKPNMQKESNAFIPNANFPDFIVRYPGKTEHIGDYLFIGEIKKYSHENIWALLFFVYIESCNRFLDSKNTIDDIFNDHVRFLETIYLNGTQYDYSGFPFVVEAEKYADIMNLFVMLILSIVGAIIYQQIILRNWLSQNIWDSTKILRVQFWMIPK